MVSFIAEFCQNHNGDFSILQEVIHRAAENGAVYGKIQTIFADDLTFRERFENGLVEQGTVKVVKRPYLSEYERLKKLELSYEQQAGFIGDCRKYGLIPMTTCFTRGSVKKLAEMGWGAVKVASYDCASLPLLMDLCDHFDHLIVSTGATYDHEIEAAALLLRQKAVNYSFLHCVTIYPTPLRELHLNRMVYLKRFSNDVGLPSHTLTARDGIKADLAAVYLGAEYIERHFTILNSSQTKDGPISIGPEQIREIVEFSRLSKTEQKDYIDKNIPEFKEMLGAETRAMTNEELLNRDYYRGRFATREGDRVIYNWEE